MGIPLRGPCELCVSLPRAFACSLRLARFALGYVRSRASRAAALETTNLEPSDVGLLGQATCRHALRAPPPPASRTLFVDAPGSRAKSRSDPLEAVARSPGSMFGIIAIVRRRRQNANSTTAWLRPRAR